MVMVMVTVVDAKLYLRGLTIKRKQVCIDRNLLNRQYVECVIYGITKAREPYRIYKRATYTCLNIAMEDGYGDGNYYGDGCGADANLYNRKDGGLDAKSIY